LALQWIGFYTFDVKGNFLVSERIILGIDPGTSVMGYGIVLSKGNKLTLICHGVLRLEKVPDHGVKLKKIFEKVVSLVEQYHPDELAIEAPFFGKNVQSMLKLGRAQGVAISAALQRDIPFTEYAPRRIKQAITGNGNASKEQVAKMVQNMLKMEEIPKFLDATDGLAAAVCHSFQKVGGGDKDYTSWKGFISKNPGRKLN
jgi:crossover junction endodeoxyribonuclease RuvC